MFFDCGGMNPTSAYNPLTILELMPVSTVKACFNKKVFKLLAQ